MAPRLVPLALLIGCGAPGIPSPPADGGAAPAAAPAKPKPEYDVVLPADKVKRIDIQIAASDWAAIRADMNVLVGTFGSGGLVFPKPGTVSFFGRDPMHVQATVTFEGKVWTDVGFRYRGNATLAYAWRQGKNKLPFKLDFDGERLHGFKNLAFVSNYGDASLVREKVAGDLFRAAGVICGRSAFYRVFIDHGAGPLYFGLYTAVETPDKPMLLVNFGDSDGNLYKPDGDGAKFVRFDEASFPKKSNEMAADYSDVRAVFAALQARSGLERVFDVPGFLRWLAVNTTMTNWDTYGQLPHNFYLYADPRNGGRLHWIPWDHNEAMEAGAFFNLVKAPSVSLREVDRKQWPLIALVDEPTYRAAYHAEVRRFIEGPFALASVIARLRTEHTLIAPYVVGADGEKATHTLLNNSGEFGREIETIVRHVQDRFGQAALAPRGM